MIHISVFANHVITAIGPRPLLLLAGIKPTAKQVWKAGLHQKERTCTKVPFYRFGEMSVRKQGILLKLVTGEIWIHL